MNESLYIMTYLCKQRPMNYIHPYHTNIDFHWYAVCDINISLNMPKSLSKKDFFLIRRHGDTTIA